MYHPQRTPAPAMSRMERRLRTQVNAPNRRSRLPAEHAQIPVRTEQNGPPQIEAAAGTAEPEELLRVDLRRTQRGRFARQPERLAGEERDRRLQQLDLEPGPPRRRQ